MYYIEPEERWNSLFDKSIYFIESKVRLKTGDIPWIPS